MVSQGYTATPSKIIMKKIESNQRVEQSTDQRIQANIKRINSRFNSLKRDPISTITVKLRASALKETT